jgi:hypothetical protein
VPTELDQKGQAKRRNCRQCFLEGKKDMKAVFMCDKCTVPLHTHCFKERILYIQSFIVRRRHNLQILKFFVDNLKTKWYDTS